MNIKTNIISAKNKFIAIILFGRRSNRCSKNDRKISCKSHHNKMWSRFQLLLPKYMSHRYKNEKLRCNTIFIHPDYCTQAIQIKTDLITPTQ